MITGGIGISIGAIALLLGAGGLAFEWQHRRRPGNDLDLALGNWQVEVYEPNRYLLVGDMSFRNRTLKNEIMVTGVTAEATLLSSGSLEGVAWSTKVVPGHQDVPTRADNYWPAYIVKLRSTTRMEVSVEIEGSNLSELQSAWVRVDYVTYGPQGLVPKRRHVIVPLKFPSIDEPERWRPMPNADVLPIKTHLLTHLDDPVAIVKRYVMPHAQSGDVVTIGETPVALMQGRFRHPSEVKPGWVAQRLCYFFLPTSSLATACGLQALVDIVGPARVVFAFVVGAIAKVFGKPGVFYQLAGEQARLIDDVSGTLPPYDQFIVLGPEKPQQIVNQIQKETGLSAAIVDVNDLKAVKILAATSDLSISFLEQALRNNPAGNADEQTPVVLIRPTESVSGRQSA